MIVKIEYNSRIVKTIFLLLFFGIFSEQTAAHPALDMLSLFFKAVPQKSEFKKYMETPLRQKLSSEKNVSLVHNPNDGSNWSGCQVGKGVLAGTFRDISACAASACYGRDVTVEEMKNLSYVQAEKVVHWLWDFIQAEDIPDQSVANLTMSIQMQYGNIRIVQSALNQLGANLRLNGRMDKKTLQAIQFYTLRDSTEVYNSIRNELIKAYGRMSGSATYINILNREYPPQLSFEDYYNIQLIKGIKLSILYTSQFLTEGSKIISCFQRLFV
jgi:hypothetical protein